MQAASVDSVEATATRGEQGLPWGATRRAQTQSHHQQHHPQDARFSCSICTDAVIEPVVTQCGHLYCWPCLYRWLEPGMTPAERASLTGIFAGPNDAHDPSKRVCPVCRAACSVKRVVPIYVRTETTAAATTVTATATSTSYSPLNDEIEVNHSAESNDDELILSEDEDDDSPNQEQQEHPTGLRHRLRFRSTDSEIPNHHDMTDSYYPSGGHMVVPRRPAAHSPAAHLETTEHTTPQQHHHRYSSPPLIPSSSSSSPPLRQHPLSPGTTSAGHSASLSHGMLPLVQQALRRAGSDFVPPLHRLENVHGGEGGVGGSDPGATEFLSRLLLLLGSFVIFCLLLF